MDSNDSSTTRLRFLLTLCKQQIEIVKLRFVNKKTKELNLVFAGDTFVSIDSYLVLF